MSSAAGLPSVMTPSLFTSKRFTGKGGGSSKSLGGCYAANHFKAVNEVIFSVRAEAAPANKWGQAPFFSEKGACPRAFTVGSPHRRSRWDGDFRAASIPPNRDIIRIIAFTPLTFCYLQEGKISCGIEINRIQFEMNSS